MKIFFTIFLSFTTLLLGDIYKEGEAVYFQKGCNSCHGANGEGLHEFPKLANQSKKDLLRKLNAYRADKIKTPQASVMTGYAKSLTQSEMDDIIYYLANFVTVIPKQRYIDTYDSWGDGGS